MPWESKRLLSFDHYKSNDDYRDCCAAVYTELLQAEESACPWTLSASHGLSGESFHGKPKRIWQGCYCWKLNTQFNLCQSQIYNVSWIQSHQVSYVKVRALIGKEGNLETWNGNIWLDSDKTENLKTSLLFWVSLTSANRLLLLFLRRLTLWGRCLDKRMLNLLKNH